MSVVDQQICAWNGTLKTQLRLAEDIGVMLGVAVWTNRGLAGEGFVPVPRDVLILKALYGVEGGSCKALR